MTAKLLSGFTLIMLAACAAPAKAPRSASQPRAVASDDMPQQVPAEARAPLLEERVRMAMLAPASQTELAPASGTSCSIDVDVTDLGGVSVTYRASPGHERELRASVHAMAARHNKRATIAPSASDSLGPSAALARVESVAVVEDTVRGARVVLVPEEAWELTELFAHTEMHAPDLFPAALLGERCPKRPIETDR